MATSPSQKVITPLGAVDLSMAKAFGTPQNLLAAIRSGVIKAEPVTPSAAPKVTAGNVPNYGPPAPTSPSSGAGTATTTPSSSTIPQVDTLKLGPSTATSSAGVTTAGTVNIPAPDKPTVIKKQEPLKPITNIEEAQRFVNGAPNSYYRYGVGVGGMGKYIPSLKDLYSDLEYYALEKKGGTFEFREKQINRIYGELTKAYLNPKQYAFDEVHRITKRIVTAGSKSTYNPNDYTLDNNNLQKTIKYLLENENVNVSALQSVISNATKLGIEQAQQDIEYNIQANKPRGIDRFFDFAELAMGSIALPAMGNVLAGSLGVSAAAGNAIANTIAGITNGGDPQEILKRTVAGMTAYQAGEYVAALSKLKDPIIQNTLGNSVTQGVNAALLGQDVKTALLAGAAGGAVAGGVLRATDDRAIAAAAGEYTKNIQSGMSQSDALASAVADFVLSDRGDAEQKIRSLEEGSQATVVKPGTQIGDPFAGTGGMDISVPSNISSLKEFQPLPGETGEQVIKYTDRDGIVSYKKNITKIDPVTGKETGYTIVYEPDIKKFTYEFSYKKDSIDTIVSQNTRPSFTEVSGTQAPKTDAIIFPTGPKTPVTPTTQPVSGGSTAGVKDITKDIINLAGIGTGTTGGATTGGAVSGATSGGAATGGGTAGADTAGTVPSAPTGVVPSVPSDVTTGTTTGGITTGGTAGTVPSDTTGTGTTTGITGGTTGGTVDGTAGGTAGGTGAGESIDIGTGTGVGTGTGTGTGVGTGTGTGTGTGAGIGDAAGTGAGGEGTGGEGAGEGGTGKGGEGEGIGGGGGEGEGEGEGTGAEPMTDEDLILLGLISPGGAAGTTKPIPKSTTAAMQALSQALRIGDPGEPLFGSRLGKRKNVWNVESLRIKDELGG